MEDIKNNNRSEKKEAIQFRMSIVEREMLMELCAKFGTSISELLRGLVHDKYTKTFPAYMVGKKYSRGSEFLSITADELTPEQACEAVGGKIITENGIQKCSLQLSPSMTRKIPLVLIGSGEYTVEKLKAKKG